MRLILQDGDSKRGLRLKDGTFSIGSGDDCKITLESKGVAEHHADLVVEGGVVTLKVVDTDHPVTIGGESVADSVELESGQLFSIGGARFKLDATSAASKGAAPAAQPASKRASSPAAARPQRVERS
ncbi:MAG: FHA domain-containing protein, partial [Planctomycetota bacterium]|nr:FHA domain-containing protein [Planctomycetota bacterium]